MRRAHLPDGAIIVTPGIRLRGTTEDDHAAVSTPLDAAQAGALLVIGRSAVSSRQAAVSLGGFVRGFDDGTAVVRRAAPADGSRDRGFAEVLRSGRAGGTSGEMPRRSSPVLSLRARGWKIDGRRRLR